LHFHSKKNKTRSNNRKTANHACAALQLESNKQMKLLPLPLSLLFFTSPVSGFKGNAKTQKTRAIFYPKVVTMSQHSFTEVNSVRPVEPIERTRYLARQREVFDAAAVFYAAPQAIPPEVSLIVTLVFFNPPQITLMATPPTTLKFI
jgi:hypothetical protein